MNSELQAQTDAILKALHDINTSIDQMHLTCMIAGVVIVALLIIIAFRKRH